ncbi:MAG: DUF4403 family protein [Saprospiraceae bacterium]
MEVPVSIFNLPVIIPQENLASFINEKIPKDLYEKEDQNDGLKVSGTRIGQIGVKMVDSEIRYTIQIILEIEKRTLLGKFNAKGIIELDLKTSFILTTAWKVSSTTVLAFYEWKEKPSVKTGLGNLNVKGIADIFLEKNESRICESIDKAIEEQVNFKNIINPVWDKLNESILLPKPLNANFLLRPENLSLSPFKGSLNQIQTLTCIKANPSLDFSLKAANKPLPLPPFSTCDFQDSGFQIYMPVSINYDMATKLATEYLRGQKFEVSGQEVILETIEIGKSEHKLEIALGLSGFIKGVAIVKFIPTLNKNTSEILIQEVEFNLKTKNIFAKGASWLLKKSIIDSIKNNANNALQEGMEKARAVLVEELRSIDLNGNGTLDAQIESIALNDFQIEPTKLSILIFLKGDGQLNVVL